MSERLPVVSGKDLIRVLQKQGWVVRRQTGSHSILSQDDGERTVSVPQHRTLDKGLLATLLKQAKLSAEEFRKLL